jgi:hypothetical protein
MTSDNQKLFIRKVYLQYVYLRNCKIVNFDLYHNSMEIVHSQIMIQKQNFQYSI